MAAYEVEFLPEACDDLNSFDPPIARRILGKIKWLAEHFGVLSPEPLKGEMKSFFKLRVGAYRVIYSFDTEQRRIIVHLVGHRKDLYSS